MGDNDAAAVRERLTFRARRGSGRPTQVPGSRRLVRSGLACGTRPGTRRAANGAVVEHLRFDPTPPTASRSRRLTPPTRRASTCSASDEVSGVAGGEVEVQRAGENVWRPLPTQVVADGLAATSTTRSFLTGRIASAPACSTRRATNAAPERRRRDRRRADAAAAHQDSARGRQGQARSRAAPAREAAALSAHPRQQAKRRATAERFASAAASRRREQPGRRRCPSRSSSRCSFLALRGPHVASVPTSRTGRFTYKALRGPSRLVQFRYGGTATVRPRTSTVALLIRGSTSLDVDRHRAVNGDDIVFRGHVRGRPLPPQGKLVELQVYTRRRWRTFAQPRADAQAAAGAIAIASRLSAATALPVPSARAQGGRLSVRARHLAPSHRHASAGDVIDRGRTRRMLQPTSRVGG